MTATDRAFIQAFDDFPRRADLAPHVLFAARGVQMTKTIAAADALTEERSGAGKMCETRGAKESRGAATAPRPDGAVAKARPAVRQVRQPQSTYLPSQFRNLVGVGDLEDSPSSRESSPIGPAVQSEARDTTRTRLDRGEPSQPPAVEREANAFRPALEVDALRWPAVVDRLLDQHTRELDVLCDALGHAMKKDQRVIAVQSTGRGVGCTTVALTLARLLAADGRSVAVVDGQFVRPGLAASVGLVIDSGWEKAIVSDHSIAEWVIQSLLDKIAIVPLVPVSAEQLGGDVVLDRIRSAMLDLAGHFEIVLVDAGPPVDPSARMRANPLADAADACVLVHAYDPQWGNDDVPQVDLSLPLIGVVENLATGVAAGQE
jgi:Mrp family chromosome partitioning ATPase